MSRHSRKRAPYVSQRDDGPLYIALIMFGLIFFLALFGKLFRRHSDAGNHPFPWMITTFLGIGVVLTVGAIYKRFCLDGKAPPKFLRRFISRESPV